MPSFNSLVCLSIVSFGESKDYTVYFIRHADSKWNEFKDKTPLQGEIDARLSELKEDNPSKDTLELKNQAEKEIKQKVCAEMESGKNFGAPDSMSLVREVKAAKNNALQFAKRNVQAAALASFHDAELSDRGKAQADCLWEWFRKMCVYKGSASDYIPTDESIDACRVAGMVDVDKQIVLVSNLQRTKQTFIRASIHRCGTSPKQTSIKAKNFLQERGCSADARPTLSTSMSMVGSLIRSISGIGAHQTTGSKCNVEYELDETKQDICVQTTDIQNKVYDDFIDYIGRPHSGFTDNPIFVITGHSTWLRDFFRSKILADDAHPPNKLEILLTNEKLGNASVIKFTVRIDETARGIVPDTTKLLYGYVKGEPDEDSGNDSHIDSSLTSS